MRSDEHGQVTSTRRLLPIYKMTADGPVLVGHCTWSLMAPELLRELADRVESGEDLRPDAREVVML